MVDVSDAEAPSRDVSPSLRAVLDIGPDDVVGRTGLPPGRHALISVVDTGTGIPPEVMERLFEPFFTTKPPEKGSGLGLPAVYGFARRSGGTAWAESVPGKGATFFVALPRLAAPTSPTSGSG